MTNKEQTELTDQELLDIAKKEKSTNIINAFLIGLVIGIIFYGVVKNNFGFFALIPIFVAFKIFNKPKNNKPPEE
jgi:hypothetical protein